MKLVKIVKQNKPYTYVHILIWGRRKHE